MATPYTFQSLNFNNIPGREAAARKQVAEGWSGLFNGIGSGAKDIAEQYSAEEERRKKEAADKRQWDNMIAEQEYRKKQDEYNRKYQEKRDVIEASRYWNDIARREAEEKRNKDALAEAKKYIEGVSLDEIKKYGPQAQMSYGLAKSAGSMQDLSAGINSLGNAIAQYRMYEREMNEDRINDAVRQVESRLSKAGVNLDSTSVPKKPNDKRQMVVDKDAIGVQIALIDEELKNLEFEKDSDASIRVRNLLNAKRASLENALYDGIKKPSYSEILDGLLSQHHKQ